MSKSKPTSRDFVAPCLRWAGGKSRLLNVLIDLIPEKFGTYLEPMVGGGAVFFSVQPETAIISDINSELINYYKVLRNNPHTLIPKLTILTASEDEYYQLRSSSPSNNIERAVRFAYLNRLSWNGLYRVNKNGKFNVPFGGRLPKKLWDPHHLFEISRLLQSAELRSTDFQEVVNWAKEGDFVYLDPPYPRGALNGNGFNRYASTFFTYHDHVRLTNLANDLSAQGVSVLVTESNDPKILELFDNSFKYQIIQSKSLFAANSHHRRNTTEAAIFNY